MKVQDTSKIGCKVKNFLYAYRHAWILSYFFVYMIWFSWLEKNIIPRYWMQSPLDEWIPFVPLFIIPYLLWFLYVAIAVVYFLFHSKLEFQQLCAFLFIGMSICLTLYMLFPNGQRLRPEIMADTIWELLVARLYSTDTPTNVAPSIHVYNSIGVHIAVVRSAALKKKRWLRILSFVLMMAIIVSTVTLKQHSIDDVFLALPLCLGMYLIVYRFHIFALLTRGRLQKGTSKNQMAD